MKERIKRFVHDISLHLVRPHLPDARTSASAKASMACMMLELQSLARSADQPLPRLCDSGFRVFSQFEEDGYLLYLAAVLEIELKIFLDIGAADQLKLC